MSEKKIERGFVPGENLYVRKSKDEIRQIALDNLAGTIFGSWQMSKSDMAHLHLVFMPVFFADDFMVKGWERDEVIHFYGHLHDSLNRAINGMPIFHSFYVINQSDLERVFKMQKMISAIEEED